MGLYTNIMPLIDKGRGLAANAVGVPYNVFRLIKNSNGNLLDPSNEIGSNIYGFRKVTHGGTAMETTTKFNMVWYKMVFDLQNFLTGDVFVQNDPIYGKGATLADFTVSQFDALCLAFHPPIKDALGVRLDRIATIFRPNLEPTTGGYWKSTVNTPSTPATNNALPVILVNGQYTLGTVGQTPTQMPIGCLPARWGTGGSEFSKIPGMVKIPEWHIYVPPMQGFVFQSGDRIVAADGSQYTVSLVWNQVAGTVGNQLFCDRDIEGTTE